MTRRIAGAVYLSDFILALPILLFSMVAHEYAHARTALWQGDDTGYMLGRVTLNPLPHIDPWFTLLIPALLWFQSGGAFVFGGARPVPITPRKFRKFVRGDLIVSAAGIVTNLGLALACAALFVGFGAFASFLLAAQDGLAILQRMLLLGIKVNLLLAVFNLIPIPPLDGSHLLYHALPTTAATRFRAIGQFGFLPLLALMFFFPGVLHLLLTPATWGFAQLKDLVSPFGIGELWDFTRG